MLRHVKFNLNEAYKEIFIKKKMKLPATSERGIKTQKNKNVHHRGWGINPKKTD